MQPDAPLKTFICYAHEDHEVVDGLKKQLAIFEKKGLLQLWSDGKILAGEHWDKSIKAQLEHAELILLFVSVDFINSDYIETTELEAALQRHREGHATLIPIVVRPCHWAEYFDIGQFQALPVKARPILSSHFPHRDEAFFEIAEGVKKTAEGIRSKKIAAFAAEAQRAKEEEAQRVKEAAEQAALAAAALAANEAAAAKALAAKQEVQRQHRQADSLRLKDEAAWESAIEENTLHAYDTYLEEGFTLHKSEAEKHIKALQFAELKRKAKEAETRKSKEEKRALSRNVVAVKTVASLSQMFPTGILLRNMVDVKGGTFRLPDKVECTLSDFAIGKYQVTFEEYDRYCEAMKIDKPSDKGWGRGKRPVINVSWFDAVVYCNWLSEENGLARAYKIDKEEVSRIPNRKGFRLPTEAEWVFAYRGGIQSKGFTFSGSNNLDEVGWYWWNSGDRRLSGEWTPGKSEEYNCRTHYVGEKQPNELGLHDMSGNVYEWCWDWWATHPASKQKNPQGAESGHNRVIMGGSWDDDHSGIGMRGSVKPESRSSICGFRLAQDK